jgi:hypothetical protein
MTESIDTRELAIERIKAKRDFWMHAFVYLTVNAFLVVIWFVTNSSNHFWPIWSIGGWGIGLVAHAVETYRNPISEASIEREMKRLVP